MVHGSPLVDTEKASEEPSVPKEDEGQTQYPGGRTVALIMIALYLAVFLVALVSSSTLMRIAYKESELTIYRIEQSLLPPCPVSPMISILWLTLAGTEVPTCLPVAPSNLSSAESTHSIPPSGSSWLPSVSLKSDLLSAALHRTRRPSSWGVPSLA